MAKKKPTVHKFNRKTGVTDRCYKFKASRKKTQESSIPNQAATGEHLNIILGESPMAMPPTMLHHSTPSQDVLSTSQ